MVSKDIVLNCIIKLSSTSNISHVNIDVLTVHLPSCERGEIENILYELEDDGQITFHGFHGWIELVKFDERGEDGD